MRVNAASAVQLQPQPSCSINTSSSDCGQVTTEDEAGQPVVQLNVFTFRDCTYEPTMIHITVPDTQTLVEKKDGVSKYTAYNVWVNGWYHAAVRFNQLYALAENAKQRFGIKYKGPEFPPKRLLKLDERQIEERRHRIAKYLNALVQHADIIRHSSVEQQFLHFQLDSFRSTSSRVTLDVYLPDGEKLKINCDVHDSTTQILKFVSEKLNEPDTDRLLWKFGLFMAKPRDDAVDSQQFDMQTVRILRNFESPYVSLHLANQKSAARGVYYKIILKKMMWHPLAEERALDEPLMHLLYRQAVTDFRNGYIPADEATTSKLTKLAARGDQVQFLRTCHKLSTYSYEMLEDVVADFPQPNTRCQLKIGRRQLVLTYNKQGRDHSAYFRATRIRVWRISRHAETQELLFEFEYLSGESDFRWVTLVTEQAVLLSLLLQSIGTEILVEHRNQSIEEQMYGTRSAASYLESKPTRHSQLSDVHQNGTVTASPTYANDENHVETTHHERVPPPIARTNSNASETTRTTSRAMSTKSETSEEDPLGVAASEIFESFNDVFTTITHVLPQSNTTTTNITDEDL